jgi:uncharacterized protein YkwD
LRGISLCLLAVLCFGQEARLGDAVRLERSSKHLAERHEAVSAAVPATWYDTSNRATVAQAYRLDFLPSRLVPTGSTGDVATGSAGDVSGAYRSAVNQRVNWFRAMAGVPAWITLDPTYNDKSQKAALMMAANGALSHYPPTTWTWYTAQGAEAAGRSNLCQGFESDPGCVAQYIADQGSNNAAVGHRRWILYPQTRLMGTGDLPYNGNLWNALWVIDSNTWAARPSTRDEFVAWPPKGYVPYQVVYPRWSFSYPGADFSYASVTLTRNGTPVTIAVEPVSPNIGENSIVWIPAGASTNGMPVLLPPGGDQTYRVTVANVRVGGVARSFTYDVVVFDPEAGLVVSPSPLAASFPPGGGSGGFWTNLDPPNGALPARSASASWIQLTGVSSGNTYVFYNVAPNSGPPRTGTITVGDAAHTITQGGTGCGFSLNSTGLSVVPDSVSGQINLTASASNCTWSAASNRSWLQIFPLAGTGSAPLYYTVFPNFSASARTGTITVADRQFTITQAGGTGSADERFVRLLYFNYFGRLPSPSELAFQTGSGLPRPAMAQAFLNSEEFNNSGRFVAGLYVGILNRDAEYGGWLFQRNALSTGQTTPETQTAAFLGSAEFVAKYGTPTDAEFVRLMYRQILGREATPDEVTWRVSLLVSGMSRAVMTRDLLNSVEFRTGKNARLLAFLLYATLLNRDPTTAEYTLRRDQIAANSSDSALLAIITDIVNSTEFAAQLQ